MVALRKISILSILVACTGYALAQDMHQKLSDLETKAEKSMITVDSMQNVVRSLRNAYQDPSANRDSVAVLLKKAEKQSYNAIIEKKKADEELENFLKAHPELKASLRSTIQKGAARTDVAFLTDNAFFKNGLSSKDYALLKSSEKDERETAALLEQILRRNSTIDTLCEQYNSATEEEKADSIYHKYLSECALTAKAERQMMELWQTVYDNKTYIYSLLMEKNRRQSVLELMEQSAASAREKIAKTQGLYFSDAVASYYYYKTGLLSSERRIATEMNFKKAQDSLSKEITRIQKIDILRNRSELHKRDFIVYEPIKVIKPQFYNTKNPVPQTKIYSSGIIYRIRLGIYTNRPNLVNLRYVTPLSYTTKYNNGKYAYFTGGFRTEEEAIEGVKTLKKLGFRDPRIVMWVDGQYISDPAKWKEENHGFSVEIDSVETLSEALRKAILERYPTANMSKAGSTYIISGFLSQSQAVEVQYLIQRLEPKAKTAVVKK